jgi:hypothetical protein
MQWTEAAIMSISRRGRIKFSLQLARMVATCEAELSAFVFVPGPFISWALLCLLAFRWLALFVEHFERLKIGFSKNLDANTSAECCMCE